MVIYFACQLFVLKVLGIVVTHCVSCIVLFYRYQKTCYGGFSEHVVYASQGTAITGLNHAPQEGDEHHGCGRCISRHGS